MGTTRSNVYHLAWLALGATALLVAPFQAHAQEGGPDQQRVLVEFVSPPGPADIALVRAQGRVHVVWTLVPGLAATIPTAAIPGLLRNPRVVCIEEDGICQTNDEYSLAWGVGKINAATAHGNNNTGQQIKVAVIDTGVDYTHPELAGVYAGGKDFVNNDNDPMDDHWHGTHTSGTVAAALNQTDVVGVAPGVQLYALKVLNASGSGQFSWIISAMQWCVTNGIQVTNNSYGSSTDPGSLTHQAFDNAAAAGVVNVCSAGNSGNPKGKGNKVGYPARYASTIAVAATDQADNRASFSSTGPAVDYAAPGVGIPSTVTGGGLGSASGTSMSCPHVAGTVALLLAGGMQDGNGDGELVDDARSHLTAGAVDLGATGHDNLYGWGRIDAAASLASVTGDYAPVATITAPADGSTYDSGATIALTGTAYDAEGQLFGTLTWSATDGTSTVTLDAGLTTSATLDDGSWTITATATDTGGQTGSDSITVTVGASSNVITVAIIKPFENDTFNNRDKILIDVEVLDGGNPVSGVVVTVRVVMPNNTYGGSPSTGTDGIASVSHKVNVNRDGSGQYTLTAEATVNGTTYYATDVHVTANP